MTPERIARLWTAVCGADPEITDVWRSSADVPLPDVDVVLPIAVVKAPGAGGLLAYGLTDDEALGALWELVCLHARVRRDEINAAMTAEGMRV